MASTKPQNRDELLALIKRAFENQPRLSAMANRGTMQHRHQLMCAAMMSNSVLKKATAWMYFAPSLMCGREWDAIDHWMVELGLDALDLWRTVLDYGGGEIAEMVARECGVPVTELNTHFAKVSADAARDVPEQAGC